jgi:hypothetical protein
MFVSKEYMKEEIEKLRRELEKKAHKKINRIMDRIPERFPEDYTKTDGCCPNCGGAEWERRFAGFAYFLDDAYVVCPECGRKSEIIFSGIRQKSEE